DEARVGLLALPGARETPAVAQLRGGGAERRAAGDPVARLEEQGGRSGQGGGAHENRRAAAREGAGEPNGGEPVPVGRGELESHELAGDPEQLGERLHVPAFVIG